MKTQSLVASALALAVISGSVLAAHGDVQFIGVVTDTTCDITVESAGAVKNIVQLGTAKKGGTGPIVDFTLKTDGSLSCTGLVGDAIVGWAGPFTTEGLAAQSGAAADAVAVIKTVNANTGGAVQSITKALTSTTFDANILDTDGAKFHAQLNGGMQVGDYHSAAAFVVAYP
ncbi:MAG: fimbrial protein PefA [Plesiomonas sp.]|uniref:fimbrial protein PefA n=1 Tax=Plesiomonas sp. TaxID=2486279 RepID=UPI003F2FD336